MDVTRAEITQRRIDGAVDGVGVIETASYKTMSTRSGLNASSKNCQSTDKSLATDVSTRVGNVLLKRCEAKDPIITRLRRLGVCPRRGKNNVICSTNAESDTKKTLLHPMRFNVPEGSITAILGTSESGKSTLMKFLAGCADSNLDCEGVVNLPGTSSYLPEEVNLHRFYTARTYIKHYDKLLASSSAFPDSTLMSDEDIERLLDSLRISKDRRDTVVGDSFRRGLSLGEQRRLELGLLVLGAPDTLFCENPVEGLDSETSLHIMEFLKGYSSNSSRRVIITLNRPSNFIWNLIDNVILLSRGRVVYEGTRFDMEAFFAHHQRPTPKRFSPIEHYLAVVNGFRQPSLALNWEANFKKWQEESEEGDGDDLGDDIETCFPSNIPDVIIPQKPNATANTKSKCSKLSNFACGIKYQLVHRYMLQMFLNPGILQIRLVMYTMLSLFLGALFFNLEKETEDIQSIDSHAALLFYSSSFYIFMVCATLPFLAIDLKIRDKEVLNGFYHPITHHLAVALSTIPACLILSLVISAIQVNMVGLQNGIQFFLILTLALWCGDALAMLVSLCAPHFVIGIVVCAGICGFFMAIEGFMLVPSKFPLWLRWTYPVPFHTYVFRSLMFNEFYGDQLGSAVLESYEIESTNVGHDMVVLLCYSLIIHALCILKIAFGHTRRITNRIKDA
jgi:ABC-type multidrug transport system ATPase subunit